MNNSVVNYIFSRALNKIASKDSKPYNPYENWDTLLAYHSKGPDIGKTAKDSALYHLSVEFNKALGKSFAGTGSKYFVTGKPYELSVQDAKTPLGDRLGTYASDIRWVMDSEPDLKRFRINWGKDGDMLLINDITNNRHKLNPKYKEIRSIQDEKQYIEAVGRLLKDMSAFSFTAERAPSSAENKREWAK